MHDLGGLGKCGVGIPHSHERLGLVKRTSRWFVVVHDKTNGQCELQSSMRHDKLGDMGHLVPMIKKKVC